MWNFGCLVVSGVCFSVLLVALLKYNLISEDAGDLNGEDERYVWCLENFCVGTFFVGFVICFLWALLRLCGCLAARSQCLKVCYPAGGAVALVGIVASELK